MDKTNQILSNIYVILTVICFAQIAALIIRFVGFMLKNKVNIVSKAQDDFNNLLSDLFRRDELEDIKNIANEKIKTEKNNITALLWLMRVAHKEGKRRQAALYAEDIINIDPSYSDYAKNFMDIK
ncbi:hypothetical protein [Methylocella sp.]|uniref:hypothetical protein n=1 Tax=Methylocella sp. TaxID=1978226 RepID=UPI0037845EAA